MSVRTTALLMMISLAGTFLIRTANSLWPALYASLSSARFVAFLLLVAGLFTLSFFWSVWSTLDRSQSRLARASLVATVGAALVVLLRLRSVLFLLSETPGNMLNAAGGLLTVLELAGMLTFLWFFYVVNSEIAQRLPGTGGAVIGAALFAFAALLTLFLHVVPARPPWLAERSGFLVFLSIPLGLLAVGGLLLFLVSVRQHPEALVGGGESG
jgi:hypothetical protein